MLQHIARSGAVLVSLALTLFSACAQAQDTPATIPSAFVGGYSLELIVDNPAAPLVAQTNLPVYITVAGDLCVNELQVSDPVFRDGDITIAYWDAAASGLSFSLDITQVVFAEMGVLSSEGVAYGRLVGTGPTTDASPCVTSGYDITTLNGLYDALEGNYPTLFPSGTFTINQFDSGFDVYRYYQSSDMSLAVLGTSVYVLGGDFGDFYVNVGEVEDLIANPAGLLIPEPLPSFYHGTFSLSLSEALPFSPIAEGTELTFVVQESGRLCVGELQFSFPTIEQFIDDEDVVRDRAVWTDNRNGIRYVANLDRHLNPETFETDFGIGEIIFQSGSGAQYGVFEGNKVSLSQECINASGGNPDSEDIATMFGLAEQQFPNMLPTGPQTYSQVADGYIFRFYQSTGIYLGVLDGLVYLSGTGVGNGIDAEVIGTLSDVLAQLNETPSAFPIPASQVGTYAMTFSNASSVSPFADTTQVDLVIKNDGQMCLDGLSLGTPLLKPNTPGYALWESSTLGVSIALELDSLSVTDLSLSVSSMDGLPYADLDGVKTSQSTECGATTTNVTLSNELFSLAQLYYSEYFPSSTLSFNQVSGNVISRYYPSTGLTLAIEGTSVSVSGGEFGSTPIVVGELSGLIEQLTPDPDGGVVEEVIIYDLTVAGPSQVQFGSLAVVNRSIDLEYFDVERPADTADSTLDALFLSIFSNEIESIVLSTYTIFSDTDDELVFTANVSSETTVVTSTKYWDYQIVFSFQKR